MSGKYPRLGERRPAKPPRIDGWRRGGIQCAGCDNTPAHDVVIEYGYMRGTDHEDYRLCVSCRALASKDIEALVRQLSYKHQERQEKSE